MKNAGLFTIVTPPDFESLADGNGFKVGGYGGAAFEKLPKTIPRNTTQFCLSVRNKASGFYANHHLVMKNNLGFAARRREADKLNVAASDVSDNSFNLPVRVSSNDFISLEQSLVTAPRRADGSLPDIDFMRLAPENELIDAGVNIGFPFLGTAPDLGYREHRPKP